MQPYATVDADWILDMTIHSQPNHRTVEVANNSGSCCLWNDLEAKAPKIWKRLQTHLGQAIQYLVLMLVAPCLGECWMYAVLVEIQYLQSIVMYWRHRRVFEPFPKAFQRSTFCLFDSLIFLASSLRSLPMRHVLWQSPGQRWLAMGRTAPRMGWKPCKNQRSHATWQSFRTNEEVATQGCAMTLHRGVAWGHRSLWSHRKRPLHLLEIPSHYSGLVAILGFPKDRITNHQPKPYDWYIGGTVKNAFNPMTNPMTPWVIKARVSWLVILGLCGCLW